MSDDTPHFDPEDREVGDDDEDDIEDEPASPIAPDDPFMTGPVEPSAIDRAANLLGEMSHGPLGWGPRNVESETPYIEDDSYYEEDMSSTRGGKADPGEEEKTPSKPPVVFNFAFYPDLTLHPQIDKLAYWTKWLVWHFELGETIPPCWQEHPAIAEELAALYESWDTVYNGPNNNQGSFDQLTWLSQLDASLRRIADRWDRSGCGSSGAHPEERVRSVWPGMTGPPEALTRSDVPGPSVRPIITSEQEAAALQRLNASIRERESADADPFANPDLHEHPERYIEPF